MEGMIFIVITVVDVRRKIIVAIPDGIKVATAASIGLFIAYVGLSGVTDTGARLCPPVICISQPYTVLPLYSG